MRTSARAGDRRREALGFRGEGVLVAGQDEGRDADRREVQSASRAASATAASARRSPPEDVGQETETVRLPPGSGKASSANSADANFGGLHDAQVDAAEVDDPRADAAGRQAAIRGRPLSPPAR